jgi:hypothetical protein
MDGAKYLVDQGHIHGGTSSLDSQEVLFDPTQMLAGILEKNLQGFLIINHGHARGPFMPSLGL